jgi:hypothetical protein
MPGGKSYSKQLDFCPMSFENEVFPTFFLLKAGTDPVPETLY